MRIENRPAFVQWHTITIKRSRSTIHTVRPAKTRRTTRVGQNSIAAFQFFLPSADTQAGVVYVKNESKVKKVLFGDPK